MEPDESLSDPFKPDYLMAWIIDDAASKIKSKSFMNRKTVKYSEV